MVHPFVLAPNFVNSYMSILFPILGSNEVSMSWSFFFLIFLCFANCILGILDFWVNIHLSVSAYQVTSFVIGFYFIFESRSHYVVLAALEFTR